MRLRLFPPKKIEAAMPALFVTMRHGETDMSNLDIPNYDLPLNLEGVMGARRAADWMLHHLVGSKVMPTDKFDRAYFSPYKRARQTMGCVAAQGLVRSAPRPESRLESADVGDILAMGSDLRLRELYFGDASRMTPRQMREAFPATFDNRDRDTLLGRTPNGDAVVDVFDRVHGFMGRLERGKKRGEDFVVAVDHGRTTRGFQLGFMGIDPVDWLDFDKDPANEIGYASRVIFSRRDPETGKEYGTYHWTSTVPLTPDNNEPPFWQEFDAMAGTTAKDCLRGVSQAWLDAPLY